MGLPQRRDNSIKFEARVIQAPAPFAKLKDKKLRLSWRTEEALKTAEHWQMKVRLKRPRGFANPGGFDYQAWLLHKGYYATGYVLNPTKTRQFRPRKQKNKPFFTVDLLRNGLVEVINSRQARFGIFYRALAVGDTSGITDEHWDRLNHTGTVHLLAISGLHVGLMATIGFFLGRLILPLVSVLGSRLGCIVPVRWVPVVTSLIFAASYAALAGFSIPTQRAIIFVAVFGYSYASLRRTSLLHVVSVALCIILLLNPFSILQTGFWLSFVAVMALGYVFWGRRHLRPWWQKVLLAQLAVFLAIWLPLWMFGLPVSLLSPVANLIAIPVVSFLLVPPLFVLLAWELITGVVIDFGWAYLDGVLQHLLAFLDFLADSRSVAVETLSPSWATISLSVIVVLTLLAPASLGLRGLTLVSLLTLFLRYVYAAESDVAQITVLDVGQGLAITGHYNDQAFLYDTGAKYSPSFDLGALVVGPYIQNQGIEFLDYLVISHGDNDHIGGLPSVLDKVIVGELVGQIPADLASVSRTSTCEDLLEFDIGEIKGRFIWPSATQAHLFEQGDRNNRSCVLLIEVNGVSLLLTGDIEEAAETLLLASGRLPRGIDVMIAPHHGSQTSSSMPFIEHLQPKHVIFSAGYKNRYGHPAEPVVSRYAQIGSQIWNTAVHGSISIEVEVNGNLTIWSERRRNAKPWYERITE